MAPVPARPCRARRTISSGLSAVAKALRIRSSTFSILPTTGRCIEDEDPGGVSLVDRIVAVEVMILKKGEVRKCLLEGDGKRGLGGV